MQHSAIKDTILAGFDPLAQARIAADKEDRLARYWEQAKDEASYQSAVDARYADMPPVGQDGRDGLQRRRPRNEPLRIRGAAQSVATAPGSWSLALDADCAPCRAVVAVIANNAATR
jgi:hypothetical protein